LAGIGIERLKGTCIVGIRALRSTGSRELARTCPSRERKAWRRRLVFQADAKGLSILVKVVAVVMKWRPKYRLNEGLRSIYGMGSGKRERVELEIIGILIFATSFRAPMERWRLARFSPSAVGFRRISGVLEVRMVGSRIVVELMREVIFEMYPWSVDIPGRRDSAR
jgi:hypothetical protein